jgi:hypothetical protein
MLRIIGANFDVDAFLEAVPLETRRIWYKGTPKWLDGEELNAYSGCTIAVSKADFTQFALQKKEATRFLEKHFNSLMRLPQFGLVDNEEEGAVLDFGIETRMFEQYTQTDYWEPPLLRLAGNLNISIALSQYEPAEKEEDDDPPQQR